MGVFARTRTGCVQQQGPCRGRSGDKRTSVQTVTVRAGDRGCGEERCKSTTALGVVGLLLPKLLPTSATVSNAGKAEQRQSARRADKRRLRATARTLLRAAGDGRGWSLLVAAREDTAWSGQAAEGLDSDNQC